MKNKEFKECDIVDQKNLLIIEGVKVTKCKPFHYLGCVIETNGEI